jgi:acetyltransferase-like isoleucine patch superfamily enzyme
VSKTHQGVLVTDNGHNNQVDISPTATCADGVHINIYGHNNHVVIGEGTVMSAGMVELRNHGSAIHIGADCSLAGSFRCRARDTHIRIGDHTTIMMAHLSLHEAGAITIGEDCMLSGDITMDVSDMHSILDVETGERINPPQDIEIGDHVWLAHGVRIMKGAQIGQHSVIGSRSMVLGAIPANSLAVGAPARVVRAGITWDRRRLSAGGHWG